MRKQWRLVILGWCLCLVLVACQPTLLEGTDEKTSVATTNVNRTETIIPQSIWEESVLPSPAFAFTITPTMPLTQETLFIQQRNQLPEWMHNFDRCALPCWLGVTPGKTKFEEAVIAAQNLGIWYRYDNKPEHKLVKFKQGFRTDVRILRDGDVNRVDSISSIYLADEEMVERIEADVTLSTIDAIGEHFSTYSMEKIVQQYGIPDAVLLDGFGDSPAPRLGYWFTLIYQQEGFSITYSGVVPKGQTIPICPAFSKNQILGFGIISQKEKASDPLDVIPVIGKFQWKTLEEASGVDLKAFYEQILDQGAETCFVVPISVFGHDE